jgi:ribosomal protein S12 methylthiotransferase
MALQQSISLEKNQILVGKNLDVLIEGQGDGLSMGRTYRDAPEIDGLTILEGEYPSGQIIPVRITDALAYDLHGVAVSEWSKLGKINKNFISLNAE